MEEESQYVAEILRIKDVLLNPEDEVCCDFTVLCFLLVCVAIYLNVLMRVFGRMGFWGIKKCGFCWMSFYFLFEDLSCFVVCYSSWFCFVLQQSEAVIFESLRRLQLMELTVDCLKVWIESFLVNCCSFYDGCTIFYHAFGQFVLCFFFFQCPFF